MLGLASRHHSYRQPQGVTRRDPATLQHFLALPQSEAALVQPTPFHRSHPTARQMTGVLLPPLVAPAEVYHRYCWDRATPTLLHPRGAQA